MVVATRATEREPEEHRTRRRRAIDGVLDQILLGDRAAFVRRDVIAQESRRDARRVRRIRQQVSGDLLGQELVEGHPVAERREHPIAPRPHLSAGVRVDAARVGEARGVEPRLRHAFGVTRSVRLLGEEALDEPLVGIGTDVALERVEFGRRRRQTREVEEQAPRERRATRLTARGDSLGLEPREDEAIDCVATPSRVAHGGQCWFRRCDEGPMRFVVRTGLDPTAQRVALGLGDRALAARDGRHALVRILGVHALEHEARVRIPGHDRGASAALGRRAVERVEAQLGLALGRIRSVAREAAVREDRTDVASVGRDGRDRARLTGRGEGEARRRSDREDEERGR